MIVTKNELEEIFSISRDRVETWIIPLNTAMEKCDISSYARIAAFLAQIGHESGRLQYVKEIWNPKQCPWQAKYEKRRDLGNIAKGDGERFKGRGLIQITGRSNYNACGKALKLNLINQPELLEDPDNAALSAAWFWRSLGCNELADNDKFETITRRINGGLNGYEDRCKLWNKAKQIFGIC